VMANPGIDDFGLRARRRGTLCSVHWLEGRDRRVHVG
jgi:hypothetical protein